MLYGATKAGLAYYMRRASTCAIATPGCASVLVKPGFVRTGMTAGLPEPPFAANPEDVAPAIVRAIDRGTPQVYVPAIWRLVMLVIRWLPRRGDAPGEVLSLAARTRASERTEDGECNAADRLVRGWAGPSRSPR